MINKLGRNLFNIIFFKYNKKIKIYYEFIPQMNLHRCNNTEMDVQSTQFFRKLKSFFGKKKNSKK